MRESGRIHKATHAHAGRGGGGGHAPAVGTYNEGQPHKIFKISESVPLLPCSRHAVVVVSFTAMSKPLKENRMKSVEIRWVDSRGVTSDWENTADLSEMEPCEVVTVGQLERDGDDYKTVVQNVTGDEICGRISIPCGCIQSVRELRKK